MDQDDLSLLTPEMVDRLLARWPSEPGSLEAVRAGENFVFYYRDPARQERYLRIASGNRRTPRLIGAEIDYVMFLHANGVKVAPAVRSSGGNWVETLETEQATYHAVVWEAVYGKVAEWGKDDDNRRYLFERGKALGKLHNVAATYRANATKRRRHWHEDDLFTEPSKYFLPTDVPAVQQYEKLLDWLSKRPRNLENYGVVHGDFGAGNALHTDTGEVYTFDFDDCGYHWFAYDLAVAISAARKLSFDYRKQYLETLIAGYQSERSLGTDTIEDVANFCHLAALYRWVAVIRHLGRDGLNDEQKALLDGRLRALIDPPQWY